MLCLILLIIQRPMYMTILTMPVILKLIRRNYGSRFQIMLSIIKTKTTMFSDLRSNNKSPIHQDSNDRKLKDHLREISTDIRDRFGFTIEEFYRTSSIRIGKFARLCASF